jgi:hypothetical protein
MALFWFLPAAALLHIFEEFVFPGGFGKWDQENRPAFAASITPGFHLFINSVFVLLCLLPLVLPGEYSVAWWLCMGSVLFVNALFHIRGTIRTRKYSPGLATSVILYLPLSVYGYWLFVTSYQTTIEQSVASSLTGVFYWLVSARIHKRRAKMLWLEKTRQRDTIPLSWAATNA